MNRVEPPLMTTSSQRQPLFVMTDGPYITSCFNLSTMATSLQQLTWSLTRILNWQNNLSTTDNSFNDWRKSHRMVTKFDLKRVSRINHGKTFKIRKWQLQCSTFYKVRVINNYQSIERALSLMLTDCVMDASTTTSENAKALV